MTATPSAAGAIDPQGAVAAVPRAPMPYAYEAHAPDGQAFRGSLDASDLEDAQRRLRSLGLRVTKIEPAQRPPRPARLGADEFHAFNQQLAHLAQSGLPIEQGLRLIAQDMRSGRMADSVRAVADELERGVPLEQAFSRHAGRFPTLYGRLVEAGVKSNNLAAVLLNLGRHLELVARMRASLWRTVSYPLMVFLALLVVLAFISRFVLPQFELMFSEMNFVVYRWDRFTATMTRTDLGLPITTQVLLVAGRAIPYVLLGTLLLIGGLLVLWAMLRASGTDRLVIDNVVLRLPLVGPVLRRSLVARWLDAVGIGVAANLDLPGAIELAGDAVRSPRLRHDGEQLIEALSAGRSVENTGPLSLLPATVPATLALASQQADLPPALQSLARLYEQQAELRLGRIPLILTPLLLLLVALSIGLVIGGLMHPLVRMLQMISSPWK